MTIILNILTKLRKIIENLSKEHELYAIDGGKIAKELGNSKVLNSVVLGLAAKHIGFGEDAWLEVLKATVPLKTIDINASAFKAGYES